MSQKILVDKQINVQYDIISNLLHGYAALR